MTKRPFRRLLPLLLVTGALLTTFESQLRDLLSRYVTFIQTIYHNGTDHLETFWHQHWEQAETIARLEQTLDRLQTDKIRLQSAFAHCDASARSGTAPHGENLFIGRAEALGYARLGDFQRVWLSRFTGFNPNRSYGAVHAGFAIGIVLAERHRPLLLLGGDPSCQFAVTVGNRRAPGIAMGRDARHMIVKYIPEWMKITPGDQVRTSGLDQTFPPGIPVGKVTHIQNMQGFQNAEIELFGDTLHPEAVWVVAPRLQDETNGSVAPSITPETAS